MEKNSFLTFNDLVYRLYACSTAEQLKESFLKQLNQLIGYSYTSMLLADTSPGGDALYQETPLCVPDSFAGEGIEYHHGCSRYNISDTLQTSIVYQQKFLGLLTLFRTGKDTPFGQEDLFYLQALTPHLNIVLNNILFPGESSCGYKNDQNLSALAGEYQLTARETQILKLIFDFKNNCDIARELSITEGTAQKHIQNIFRKMNVSAKWDLLQFR